MFDVWSQALGAHVITPASSLSALITQVAKFPATVAAKTPDAVNSFLNPNDNSSLNLSGGFADVRKERRMMVMWALG